MTNGLYSIHIRMLDGVKGRASGIIILRDGVLLGGDPYFWSVGSYTVGNGTWKGDLVTNQHTPYRDSMTSPVIWWPGGRVGLFWNVSGMAIPKFSAPRWWAAEVSVFRRHCAG